MKVIGKLGKWYKVGVGAAGCAATVVWFVMIIGSDAGITLNGVTVVGPIGTTAIILGNGYAMWCMATSGLRD